ncbi:hypothetical protein Tco_0110168 [Tanacetum coccineum]
MVGCTIASGPYMIYVQYDNYVKLDERKGSSIVQRRDMDAPIFPTSVASSEESHDDTVDIGVDRVHPIAVAKVAFHVATVIVTIDRHGGAIRGIYEHLQRVPVDEDVIALRFKVEIVESENTSLLGRIKTLEAINTRTRDQEKRTHTRMEQQLALVEETLRGMRIEMESLRTQQRETPPRGMEATVLEGMTEGIADTDMYQVVSNEIEKMDKYISGLPDNVYGNVKSSKPKTLDETIELANELMDQKLRIYAERQTDNKRKDDDLSRNNHSH